MKQYRVFLDCFSGSAADLRAKKRTPESVLEALRVDPRVSCFDMCEHYRWLPRCIDMLKRQGLIEELKEPYPWLRFRVVDSDHPADQETSK